MPSEVCSRCVPYTSYRFLQTPPLASDALAIQIVFPVIGVTPASFSGVGLPTLPGKRWGRPLVGLDDGSSTEPKDEHESAWALGVQEDP